jgi:Undecaprenyl-phosphate galactose phosphotransferase WbaP
MASVTVSQKLALPLFTLPRVRCNPWLCSLVFIACDAVALATSGMLVFLSLLFPRLAFSGYDASRESLAVQRYLDLWPALAVFFCIFTYSHLYPGIIHNAVAELRRIGYALTTGFFLMTALLFFARTGADYPRCGILLWWMVAIVLTPALRSMVREVVCRQPWWGIPVAVFDTGDESTKILRELELHPEIGLRPVVILSSSTTARSRHGLPVVDACFASAVRASGVERALLTLSGKTGDKALQHLEVFENIFPRVMILHSAAALYSLSVDARQVGGCLAVEVTRDLLLPLPRVVKRAVDVFVVILASPMVLLTVFFLALCVRLGSPGPVFYGHRRLGRDRSSFCIWKIRTMQVNAEELLKQALATDADLRDEWLRDRKLRRDPRVTKIGRFLRKTSLDELPQLWNVLRGEMSLVGPRPIVEEEVAAYGQNFSLYCRVTPGLTGLWQVSGRSTVSSSDRVRLDSYYVRNWSPWLDLHILARTAKVVLTGQGAY